MNLKYKYRLYPTPDQEHQLRKICGCNRYIWNYFLAKENDQYELDKTFNFFNKNSSDLTLLKKQLTWLTEAPATSLQQTLRYLDLALKQSLPSSKHRKGHPKFKKKKNHQMSFTLAMVNIARNLKNNKFYINKHLGIDVILHRELPSDFKTCQIKCEAGYWSVVFTCTKEVVELPRTGKSIGVDLNSKEFVGSDGFRELILKPLGENKAKLRTLQRRLSRKQKGSNNRKKAQLKLARLHHHIGNKRLDFCHKLTTGLIKEYDVICIEDLNVKQIQKKMGRVIQDNMFGMFRAQLEYKSELYGKEVVIIDRYYPSTKTCSSCGHVQPMSLSDRVYQCRNCGFELDRDLNAALNIHRAGMARSAYGNPELVDQVESQILIGALLGVDEVGSR